MIQVHNHQQEYKQVLLHYSDKNFAPTKVLDLRSTILIDGVYKPEEKVEKLQGNVPIRPSTA